MFLLFFYHCIDWWELRRHGVVNIMSFTFQVFFFLVFTVSSKFHVHFVNVLAIWWWWIDGASLFVFSLSKEWTFQASLTQRSYLTLNILNSFIGHSLNSIRFKSFIAILPIFKWLNWYYCSAKFSVTDMTTLDMGPLLAR